VKAGASNHEDVPPHIVFSATDGFQERPWTIQCEIIHQAMLGAQPADEEILLGDNPLDVEEEPPFDHHNPEGALWIDGGANATPAWNADGVGPVEVPDINNTIDAEAILAINIDLNAVLEDVIAPYGHRNEHQGEEAQISFQHSINMMDGWTSDSSVSNSQSRGQVQDN
jgi:hypothetical protein